MADHRESSVSPPSRLVGRDHELAAVGRILARRAPALVVVPGEAGMGKSTLLRHIAALAKAQGWTTMPEEDAPPLSIDDSTTDESFSTTLQRMLDATVNEDFHAPGSMEGQPEPPLRAASIVVEQLRPRAPVVLAIDGYRPSSTFANWFIEALVPAIRRADVPLLVFVADRPRDVAALAASADEAIALGRLNESAVRETLAALGQRMAPAMTDSERDEYVSEVCERPDLIGTLRTVLQLAVPSTSER